MQMEIISLSEQVWDFHTGEWIQNPQISSNISILGGNVNITGNLTVNWVFGNLNASYIQNLPITNQTIIPYWINISNKITSNSSINSGDVYVSGRLSMNTSNSSGISSVALGAINLASGSFSTIGGGIQNTVSGGYSTIGGGINNFISAEIGDTWFPCSGNLNCSVYTDENTCESYACDWNNNGWYRIWYTASGNGNFVNKITTSSRTFNFNDYWGYNPGTIINGYSDNVGFNATAFINILSNGTYSFTISAADDAALLYIDGTQVLYAYWPGSYDSENVYLTAGTHILRMKYWEGGGSASIIFSTNALEGTPTIEFNENFKKYAIIGGGENNVALGLGSSILGGLNNTALGSVSTVLGGYNRVVSDYSTISGGIFNTIDNSSSFYSNIGGGEHNTITLYDSVIGGGGLNTINAYDSVISGGNSNLVSGSYGVVGGGLSNTISDILGVVSGGYYNTAGAYDGIVSGNYNKVLGSYGIIGGGLYNNIPTGSYGFIGGGYHNNLYGYYNSLIGGYTNTVNGSYNSILGGSQNLVTGDYSTILGGYNNYVTENYNTVLGGSNSTAHGMYSIAGGYKSLANGNFSLAYGGCIERTFNIAFCNGTAAFNCNHWSNSPDCVRFSGYNGQCGWNFHQTGTSCTGYPSYGCSDLNSESCQYHNFWNGNCYWEEPSIGGCTGTVTCDGQEYENTDACNSIPGCYMYWNGWCMGDANSYGDCGTLFDENTCSDYYSHNYQCSYDYSYGYGYEYNYGETGCLGDLTCDSQSNDYDACSALESCSWNVLGYNSCDGNLNCNQISQSSCGNITGCTWNIPPEACNSTKSTGFGSIAMGISNVATGDYTVAFGKNNVANAASSIVFGRNINNTVVDSFQVGWGKPTLNITNGLIVGVGDINATNRVCDGSGNCLANNIINIPYWLSINGNITTNNSLNNGNVFITNRLIANQYLANDSTVGFSGTCTILGLTNIQIKNGLVVGCT